MNDEKTKILNYSYEILFKYGFNNATMDTIAQGLKISKKTLYKHFKSKDQLIDSVIDLLTQNILKQIEAAIAEDKNAIEKLTELLKIVIKSFSKINLDYFQFLNAKGFAHWEKIENFRQQVIATKYTQIIEQGKKEKLIEDKPTVILMTAAYNIVKSIVNPQFVLSNNLSFESAAKYAISMVVGACATEEGKRLFNKLTEGMKNENFN